MSFELPGGNGRDSGIAGWENMGMGCMFRMGMGMKSLKWEGIGTKNSRTPLMQILVIDWLQ